MPETAASTAQTTTPAADEALSDVAQRLADLRQQAHTSPAVAADATWEWFEELGDEARHDRDAGAEKLNELFRLGSPPTGIDGQTEGILVTPLIQPVVDRALNVLTGAWMPWLGKRFNSAESMGDNTLAGSARWPAKLFWPLYGTKPYGSNRSAFDFETRVEPGKNDPDVDVLVIDYHPVTTNPRFLIRQIRDELVEIVPGANLGKILWRSGDESYALIGFFALRSDIQ
ncbi:MAG TPA: hypothetical protein VEK39_10950 [Solirubrobacterales bacterium]|nr:hypothetical protein [Solirubrobacterales bacterium]